MTDGGILVTTPETASIINSYGFMKNVIYRRFGRIFKGKERLSGLLERGTNPEADGGISDIEQFLGELAELDPDCGAEVRALLSQFRPGIIVNRADSAVEAGVDEKLKAIARKYLSIEAECLGAIVEDLYVKAAARKMIPFPVFAPDCPAAQSMRRIAARLLDRLQVDAPLESQTA